MKNQKTMGNKGFSLVELIVVIAIMAVLVGVLAPQFIKYVESSRQSTDIQNIQQIKTAIETYYADVETASTVTITITDGSPDTVTGDATALAASGLSTTTNLKSSGWKANSWTYNTSSGVWTPAAANDPVNGKAPGKSLAGIF